MNSTEICDLPAHALRRLYLDRALSPVEVTQALLARIDALNPTLNAFVTVTPELALKQAAGAERAFAGKRSPPLLTGIPVSIKDLTPTKGIRTTKGSLLYRDWIPDFDAPLVSRLVDAGAVVLGKTNTPEFGWRGDTQNRLLPPTENPWRAGRTAGGSSGGAAAAVAAGLGPLSQGSDGGGSIRIPASFTGTFGLKPSWGLVPVYPVSAFEALSHLGPMTRDVRDAAMMLSVMAGAHRLDRGSWSSGVDYVGRLDTLRAKLRIAWSPDLGYVNVDPHVRALTTAAAGRLVELGHEVEEISPKMPDPWEIVDKIWTSAQAALHIDDFDRVKDLIDPGRHPQIEAGRALSAAALTAANYRRVEYTHQMNRFMEHYDLLVTPTMPITAFEVGDNHPDKINGEPSSQLSWAAFTYPFNLTGHPAASVPCGFDDLGLPVGLQIVGRWRDDLTVLQVARAFEQIAPWPSAVSGPRHPMFVNTQPRRPA